IDEIIASKYAARTNFVLHENAEDLASYFFIRCHVKINLKDRSSEASISRFAGPDASVRGHAAECKLTAKLARDPPSKAGWRQMAERWLQGAELADQKSSTTRSPPQAGC